MKKLVFIAGLLAFLKWRHDRFDADDAAHGYGGHARLVPET